MRITGLGQYTLGQGNPFYNLTDPNPGLLYNYRQSKNENNGAYCAWFLY